MKKDIEYTFNFTVDHLFKLEPGFDAEIIISNNKNNNIKSSKENPTGEFIGENVKIKANNDSMIYFFGKRLTTFDQLKIEPEQIGKNIDINFDFGSNIVLDFGFEGYNPSNFIGYRNMHIQSNGYIFIENIYDRLKTKLVKGEYLYLYYTNKDTLNVTYSENIRHKNNEYNFNFIPKNSFEKSLIINKGDKENLIYQVNFCKSAHNIKLYHYESDSSKYIYEFNNETTVIEKNIKFGPSIKLRFESEEDFIFSYSFIDRSDSKIKNFEKWNKERKVLTNLTIEEIIKKYPNDNKSNLFTIKFKPN